MGAVQTSGVASGMTRLSINFADFLAELSGTDPFTISTSSECNEVVVGVRNNNKRKESTRVREVCSNCQFFWLSRCIST